MRSGCRSHCKPPIHAMVPPLQQQMYVLDTCSAWDMRVQRSLEASSRLSTTRAFPPGAAGSAAPFRILSLTARGLPTARCQ